MPAQSRKTSLGLSHAQPFTSFSPFIPLTRNQAQLLCEQPHHISISSKMDLLFWLDVSLLHSEGSSLKQGPDLCMFVLLVLGT